MASKERRERSVAEVLRAISEDPEGSESLRYLDIIDAKVNAIFTFIGVLIAAVIIFISKDTGYSTIPVFGYDVSQKIAIFSSLAILLVASLFALSCIHIISLKAYARQSRTDRDVIVRINRVAESRRWRYLVALRLTTLGTIAAAFSVFLSF